MFKLGDLLILWLGSIMDSRDLGGMWASFGKGLSAGAESPHIFASLRLRVSHRRLTCETLFYLIPTLQEAISPAWVLCYFCATVTKTPDGNGSFILTIWFSPNILTPHTWADTTGGCGPGPLFISQRAGRRAEKNAGTQLAFYLFIFVPYSTWATSHRQPNTFSLGLLSVFNSLWKYAQKTPEIAVLMMLIKLQAPLEWSTMGNWAELGSRNSVTQWESEPTMVIASKEPGWVFLDDENGSFHSLKLKAKLEGSWRTSLHSWAVDEWIRTRIHILDFFSSLSMWE